MKKLIYIGVLFILIQQRLIGQDFIITQNFNNRLLNNPAFTGYEDGIYRLCLMNRAQYITPGIYNLNTLTLDTRLCKPNKKARIGIGVLCSREEQGDGYLTAINAGLSAGIHLKLSNYSGLSAGLQLCGVQQTVNWSKFVFSDQINPWGIDKNMVSANNGVATNTGFIGVDLSGGLLYNKVSKVNSDYRYVIGVSAYHLSKPNIGLTGNYLIPIRTNLHAGIAREIKNADLNFTARWIQQDNFNFQSFDVSLQVIYNKNFIGGIGLRDNVNNYILRNTLFIPLSIGLEKALVSNAWRFTLSYDINVGGIINPYGIFEFSIVGSIGSNCAKGKSTLLKCAPF